MELKNEKYQVRIRKANKFWYVHLKNVGCTYRAESAEDALQFKQRFDELNLPKGNSVHNCRGNARKAFWEIGSKLYREQRYGRGVNNG